MLVFDDQAHFDALMDDLTGRQELENQLGGREGDDREAPVFQDYADSLGFQSLLHAIESSMAEVTDDQTAFSITEDPDSHHVKDPYFRGVLNPQSEIQVGQKVYRYYPHGYYEVDAANKAALEDLRSGLLPDDGTGISFVAKAVSGGCCRSSHSKQATFTYAEGSRRMRTEQWVESSGIRVSYGVSTTNLKRVFGIWVRTKADHIGVTGSLVETSTSCTFSKPVSLTGSLSNKSKISVVREGTRPKVKDYFDSVHWAEDNGDSRQETLSMCQCLPVTASFTLPSLVDDSTKVIFNGAASQNESTYILEIYRTTSVGSNTRIGLSFVQHFAGQVGAMNLANLYNFDYLDGNAVYRVRLIARNSCDQSDDQVRWIEARDTGMQVQYKSYVQDLGWLGWVFDGETAGTTGQSLRMEATRLRLLNAPSQTSLCYRVHLAGKGWRFWGCDGQLAGTTDEDRRIEAIQIDLRDAPAGCTVQYEAHVKGDGWLGWVNEGQTAGTTGQSRRMEALRVRLVGCP